MQKGMSEWEKAVKKCERLLKKCDEIEQYTVKHKTGGKLRTLNIYNMRGYDYSIADLRAAIESIKAEVAAKKTLTRDHDMDLGVCASLTKVMSSQIDFPVKGTR